MARLICLGQNHWSFIVLWQHRRTQKRQQQHPHLCLLCGFHARFRFKSWSSYLIINITITTDHSFFIVAQILNGLDIFGLFFLPRLLSHSFGFFFSRHNYSACFSFIPSIFHIFLFLFLFTSLLPSTLTQSQIHTIYTHLSGSTCSAYTQRAWSKCAVHTKVTLSTHNLLQTYYTLLSFNWVLNWVELSWAEPNRTEPSRGCFFMLYLCAIHCCLWFG